MRVEIKQSASTCLLHCRTGIIEVAMEYLDDSKRSFEQRGWFIQGIKQLFFIGLR